MATTAGTDHVVRDVAGEDGLAVSLGVDWDLDPLEEVGQEESYVLVRVGQVHCPLTCSVGQTPASGVTDRLRGNLCICRPEELHGLHVGVLEVKRLIDGDEANVVIKGGVVPAFVVLHTSDAPALMAGLQVPVVSPGDDPVEESQLALAAVGGGDDLVPVHDGAAADVTAETLQRDLPRELV